MFFILGMKLVKIHRVLKFKQSDWLKKYIDFNTDKRKDAANSFEKDFLKLMSNSTFGKTMENLRKRINVRLVSNSRDYKKYVSKPSVVSQKIFSNNFTAIFKKPVLRLDKPIYIGFSILDLTKLLMYEFHYGYIKRKYTAKLLFTDTDSLVYEIETKDVYEDFCEDKNLFDFSYCPQDSTFFDLVNKKVISKMKDEFKGKIIGEFAGLKSKMYSLVDADGKESKKAKGVNKGIVRGIRHKEFVDVLFGGKLMRHRIKRMQSKLHRIGTFDVCKTSLPCFDNKRYILDDGINSLAYFRKDIRSQ